ncbi:hypothetical protein NBRC10513v2_002929 [Rhodotorula toruloides]|uniref:Proteasome assembly chaperone 3 n=1 Tax=Rhodotorula toruloides TaxID=5286 RepID=A0A0K3CEA4_RHOTO|nr:hypothetical protein AAT19DRAFT_14083 [Rhodotorula toruloides]
MSALLDLANLDLASTPGAAPNPPSPPSASALPPVIPTAQRARSIDGQQTDVLVQLFADRVIVVVTQMGRIGCMIQVSPPLSSLSMLPPMPPPTHLPSAPPQNPLAALPRPDPSSILTPLFGVPPSPHLSYLHDLYAAQIAAIVFRKMGGGDVLSGGVKPVVLGIGLKQRTSGAEEGDEDDVELTQAERETFAQVMEMVGECLG